MLFDDDAAELLQRLSKYADVTVDLAFYHEGDLFMASACVTCTPCSPQLSAFTSHYHGPLGELTPWRWYADVAAKLLLLGVFNPAKEAIDVIPF